MKLIIETKELARGLNRVGIASTGKLALPILECVKIEAGKDSVTLAATNLDIYATEKLPAKISKPGAATIPFNLLCRFVARLESSEVSMSLSGNSVEIKCGEVSATFESLPGSEFPPPLSIDDKALRIDCGREEFIKPLRMVSHAMSNEAARYRLMGVSVRSSKKGVTFTATNGKQMAMFESKLPALGELDAIIPSYCVAGLLKNITSGELKIRFTDTAIAVTNGESEIVSKLIEGKYPDTKSVIPKAGENVFSSSVKELISAIQTNAIFLNGTSDAITISGRKKQLQVSCGNRSKALLLGSDLKGQPDLSISVNHQYLLSSLGVLEDEVARLECSDDSTPFLIREREFTAVIAPMRSA